MNYSLGSILIVDDDHCVRALLEEFFNRKKFQVTSFDCATKALKMITSKELKPNLIICDVNLPNVNGLEFYRKLKDIKIEVPILFITAHASIETAIEAMRLGADDYILKPFQLAEVQHKVEKAMEIRNLRKDNEVLRGEVKRKWGVGNIVGKSKSMKEIFDLLGPVSQASANVLISGESGTGKEVIARAIHENGPRSGKPFIAINCTAIPEALLESELFGHAKGSFTGAMQRKKGLFEEANEGTLFLDEIGDMNPTLQAKLLRVIQERKIRPVGDNTTKEIDVRLISATHRDLKKAIEEDNFREDLFYRLSVIPIHIPPLRFRKEDIPLLAEHFLKRFAITNKKDIKGFSNEAISILIDQPLNGNVRELENIVERAVVFSTASEITEKDLYFLSHQSNSDVFLENVMSKMPTLKDVENRYIQYVLRRTGGRKGKAARILGVNRRTVYRHGKEINQDTAMKTSESNDFSKIEQNESMPFFSSANGPYKNFFASH